MAKYIFLFNRDRIRRIITTIKQRLQVRLGLGIIGCELLASSRANSVVIAVERSWDVDDVDNALLVKS